MKISEKILSIPPYISSSWKNIVSIQVEPRPFGHALIIELVTGSKVEIPNLERPTIEQIFAYHAKVVEADADKEGKENNLMTTIVPFPFPNLEGLTQMIQHREEERDTPPLPSEMLTKIAEMTKGIDRSGLQKPEPNCNCPHCQIMRAVQEPTEVIEEEVSDADLTFRNWDIQQQDDKLYSVTNPLDTKEHYNVFLGDPIGCTCGNKNCEHIQAVLKS